MGNANFFQYIPANILLLSNDLKIIETSNYLLTTFNINAQSIKDKNVVDFLNSYLKNKINSQTIFNITNNEFSSYIKLNNKLCPVIIRIVKISHKKDIAYCATVNIENCKTINENQTYNKELEKQSKKFFSIFDGIKEMIYISDLENHEILFANKYLHDLLGTNPIGKKCYEILNNTSKPCNFCTNEKISNNPGEVIEWEFYNEKFNKHFLIYDRIIDWIDNRKVRLELAIDISKRKEIQKHLEESENKFRAVIENAQNGIILLNLNTANVEYINKETERILGYSLEELKNIDIFTLFPKENGYREKIIEKFNKRKNGYIDSDEYETVFISKSGEKKNVNLTSTIIDINKRHIDIIVIKNISDKIQSELELNRAFEQLKKSNQDLEQFAFIASHDLQEPLRMISSYLSLLEDEYSNVLDEEAHEYIYYAVDGAKRLQLLIQDLLSYSRVSSRKPVKKNVDLNDVVNKVIKMYSIAIKERNTTILIDELPVVFADDNQMSLLFQNLIGNAIKFNKNENPEIWIKNRQSDNYWIFSIQDNGIGIDKKYFDKIFIIFKSLHPKDEYSGTGIGLSLCRKIVELHRGEIWVESQLGKGTTFHFSLPGKENNNAV